jgi:hypothetical protein
MLTVRGSHGKKFGLGDIGKAIKAVSKDPPKMPDAVQQKIDQLGDASHALLGDASLAQAAEDPEKLLGDASHALAGEDASEALDTAKDASQSASRALPVASVAVGGSLAGTGPDQSTKASPVGLLGEEAAGSQAVQDALSEMLKDQNVEGAVDRTAPLSVDKAAANMRESRVEDAASQVSKSGQKIADAVQDASVMEVVRAASDSTAPSSAASQAVSQAKQPLERVTVNEAMDMAGTDDAKEFAEPTWRDLNNAVWSDDVKNAIANSADGNASSVVMIVLAGLVWGLFVFYLRATKPRAVRMTMPSAEREQESTAAASHWMGTDSRNLIPMSQGVNENHFSRDAISNFEILPGP